MSEDKTIPFICTLPQRSDRELDEVQIRRIDELLKFYNSLGRY